MGRISRTALVLAVLAAAGGASWYVTRPTASPATDEMRGASRSLALSLIENTGEKPAPPESPLSSKREELLAAAYGLRGVPYEWGGKEAGALDCSGFTKLAYEAVGIELPDGSFNQAEGEQVLTSIDQLAPGDLLFYRWAGSDGVSHVTLYAGGGWAIGTGSPGQPAEVTVYPLADDLTVAGTVITYRHITLGDE